MKYITRFDGTDYAFLSNFWYCSIPFEGDTYPSTEHAYQAAKTSDPKERESVKNAPNAHKAKREGRQVTLRKDWEQVKDSVMLQVLRIKFSLYKDLEEKLLATRDDVLIEGNTWHDNHFGVCCCDKCKGKGENKLGELLMQVRAEKLAEKKIMSDKAASGKIEDRIYDSVPRCHEECCGCSKRKINPPICKGHAEGPVACLEFKAKKDADKDDIILETI
jgi:ribA/ribD-fused uncharacterized protein